MCGEQGAMLSYDLIDRIRVFAHVEPVEDRWEIFDSHGNIVLYLVHFCKISDGNSGSRYDEDGSLRRRPMSHVCPITPSEVAVARQGSIPDAVFEAFNELIVENFSGRSATVHQGDVAKLLKEKGVNVQQAFSRSWLDVEDVYRQAGWRVEYDKPGYNEDYDAYFVFTKK
jgi:hypothetical protein